MPPLPGEPGYLGNYFQNDPGATTPEPPPSTERSWGRAAIDTGIQALMPIYEAARGVTSTGRQLADDPHGLWAGADRIMGNVIQGAQQSLSPRAQQVQESKFFPGVDDVSAWQNLPAKAGEFVAGFMPYLVGGALGGGTKVAGAIGAAVMGSGGLGQYQGQLRDYADRTPIEQLRQQIPNFEQLYRDAGGDELKVREEIYRRSFDTASAIANAGINAAGGYTLTGRMGTGPLTRRMGVGATEGAATMGGATAAQEVGHQQGEIGLGKTRDFDIEKIVQAFGEGAVPGGAMVGTQRAFHGGQRAAIDTGVPADAEVALKVDAAPTRPATPPPPEAPTLSGPMPMPRPGSFQELAAQRGMRPPAVPPEAPPTGFDQLGRRLRGEPEPTRPVPEPMSEYEASLRPPVQEDLPLPTQGELFPRPVRPPPDEAPVRPDALQQGQLPLYDMPGPLGEYARSLAQERPTRPAAPPARRPGRERVVTDEGLIDFVAPEVRPPSVPPGGETPPSGGTPPGGRPVSARLQRIREKLAGVREITAGMDRRRAQFEKDVQPYVDQLEQAAGALGAKGAKVKATARRRAGVVPEKTEVTQEVTPAVAPVVSRPTGTLRMGGMKGLAAREAQVAKRPEGLQVERRRITREMRTKPGDVPSGAVARRRRAEIFDAWTGENLRTGQETRAAMHALGAGDTPLRGDVPEHFMSEQAQRARYRAGLPIGWEAFKKTYNDAMAKGEDVLSRWQQTLESRSKGELIKLTSKGRAPSQQGKANETRRKRVARDREELAEKTLAEVWDEVGETRRDLLLRQATRDIGLDRGMADVETKDRTDAERRQDPRYIERIATDLRDIAREQIKRFTEGVDAYNKANRQRGQSTGREDDVMFVPTGRSGGKEAPQFSRVSRTVKFERDVTNLLTRADKGENVTRELRNTIDTFARNEALPAEEAHASRRAESGEITERRAGEGNVGEEEVRLEDLTTDDADDPRYRMIGGRHTSGDILWERFQKEWAEDHPGEPLPGRATIDPELGGERRAVAPVDPLEAMPKHLRDIMDARERLTKAHVKPEVESRVSDDVARAMLKHDVIGRDALSDLLDTDAHSALYEQAVRRHMNRRLADIFDDLAKGIRDQRDKYEQLAREARTMERLPATHENALIRIIREDSETHPGPEARFLGEETLDKIPMWFADRYKADAILEGIEKVAPRPSRTTPAEPEPKRPKMSKKESEEIWRRRAPEEPKGKSPPPKPEVTEEVTSRADIEKGVVTVRDVMGGMFKKGDRLDDHLRDVVEQTIPDVTVSALNDATYDATMRRIAPEHVDSDGYYYAPEDRIYIRSKITGEARQVLMKHEAVHAISMAAIERSPEARAGLERLMKMVRERSEYWRHGLDNDQFNAVVKNLDDVHEFVSEVWSNEMFQRALAAVPLKKGEAIALRAPGATSWMEAFRIWVRKAVTSLFRSNSPDNALNEALVRSMDLFNATVEKGGRPVLGPGERTGAAARGAMDWLKEGRLGNIGRGASYRFKRRGSAATDRGWGARGLWAHTLDDLARRGSTAFQNATRPVLDAVARLNTARHKIAVERGDPELIREITEFMQKPQADKAADFLIRETMHGAYADEDLHVGRNSFVKPKGVRHVQVRENHAALRAEYDRLAATVPGFKELRQKLHEWGARIRQEDLTSAIRDAVSFDKLVHDAAGNVDPVASSAFAKHVLRDDASMTGPEKAWIAANRPEVTDRDSLVARGKFDKVVEDYRKLPEFRSIKGPYVPLKRHGGYAIFGEYNMPEPVNGRDLGDGYYEFDSTDDAMNFIRQVNAGAGTKLLSYERRAYRKDTGEEATELGERVKFEGGPVGDPGYVATTTEKNYRVSPDRKDPNIEVRPRLHFQTKHFELHDTERGAADANEALKSGGKVRMRPEVEFVRDLSDYQSPHFMSAAMRNMMDRVKRSAEYKRMSDGERDAWERRMSTEAAKLVLASGGRGPGLPREYVEGASRNLIESYAEASVQSAANLAHTRHGQELRDAMKGMTKHVTDHQFSEGNQLRQAVADEITRRAFTVQDPIAYGIWGQATNRLLQMTYTAKLAGTSFLAINLTEPAIIGLPILAAKYGPWQSFKTMRQAYKDLSGLKILGAGFEDMKNAFKRKNGKWTDYDETLEGNLRGSGARDAPALTTMLKELSDKGLFDRSAVNEISMLRNVGKTTKLGKGLDWIDDTFRGMNQSVETLNRAVLAVTAYRLQKGDHAAKVKAAEDAIYRGAGQYSAWNAPPAFNHPVGRVALQFKKYGQRIMSNYIQAVAGTLKGDKEKTRQLVYMLAMQAMVAGTFGLPTEVFSVPVNAAYLSGLTDVSWQDVQHEVTSLMSKELGVDAAQVLLHGLPNLGGVDVSTRFGHDSMLFFGSPKGREPQDLKASAATIALGAPGSQLEAIVKGVTAISEGVSNFSAGANKAGWEKVAQGTRELIPIRQVGDLYDAYRKSMGDGTTRTRGGAALGPEYTAGEALTRALGFTPSREAVDQEQRRVEQTAQRRITEQRKMWMDRYAGASAAERPTIKAALRDWSYGKPREYQITEADLIRAISRRRKQESRPAHEMGLSTDKRFRGLHQEMQSIYGGA